VNDYGVAWVGGVKNQKQKPFYAYREIKRGKNKGKYQITLTNGRREDGSIRPGDPVIVPESDIIRFPGETI